MTERGRNIAVGMTCLAGMVLLGVILVMFGYLPEWMEDGYEVRINLVDAGGLRMGNRAKFSGIDVGKVLEVDFTGEAESPVYAIVRVQPDVSLPANVVAEIGGGGLLGGGMTVNFVLPETEEPAKDYLARDGSAEITGTASSLAREVLNQLDAALEGPVNELTRLSANFEKLSTEWTRVGKNIGDLTEPRSTKQVDEQGLPGNLATVLARTDARLTEMESMLAEANSAFAGVNKWVNDEQLREDVTATISNARELTANINTKVDELAGEYKDAADDLSSALVELRKTIELARTGEGTVGKLLNDPALFNNLNDAAERLTAVLDEANLLLEKLKKEGIPFKVGE